MRSKLEEWLKSVGVYEFLSAPVIEVNSLESSKQLIKTRIAEYAKSRKFFCYSRLFSRLQR